MRELAQAHVVDDDDDVDLVSRGYVQGLTRLSQRTPWQDGRFASTAPPVPSSPRSADPGHLPCGHIPARSPPSNRSLGKLVDAELHFTDGDLDGLKLIGFSVWDRRGANGRNVTFPARQYSVNGERRSFALLRPIDDLSAQERIHDLVVQAWSIFPACEALGLPHVTWLTFRRTYSS